jgi:uncharacterized membrane protein
VHPADVQIGTELPQIQRITPADLRDVLAKGFDDFGKNRTDVVFLCFLYPVLGLIFARLASGNNMLPLVFPMASGFALLGPLVGVGLYEMSRLREQGVDGGWTAAFRVILSPSFGAIILLGLLLTAIFVFWLAAAEVIYMITLGPLPPVSIGSFAHDVLTTPAGWVMMGLGLAVGFIFALLVLVISVVSFPLLLDRHVGVDVAVTTSVGAVIANSGPMALWGLIVASALVIGSIPLFFGLVIVLPVLGHATWHLYRKVVAR